MNNVTKHPTAAIADLLDAMVSIESRHEGLAASMREQLRLMQILMKRMSDLDKSLAETTDRLDVMQIRIDQLERANLKNRMDMYMAKVEGHD